MSREKVETAGRCLDVVNRRDVDGYIACCTDEVELRTALVLLEGVLKGRDGIQRFFADIQDTAPDFWLDIERLEAVGSDRVLSFELGKATGRTSGVGFGEGIPLATVFDFAHGKIARFRVFADRAEALAAVGLRE
jgi:ketosteroid isomerase-like protein